MAFVAPLIPVIGSFLGSTAGVGAALTAGAAGLTALTAVQQGNYQAAVAKNNAKIAEDNAARTSEAAQRTSMRSDQDYRALLGEQLAAQGASGFDILGRTQTSARQLTERTGRRAATDITQEGDATARRSLQEAANFRAEGRQAKIQGYLTAGSALLQGASDTKSLISGRRPRSFERRRVG